VSTRLETLATRWGVEAEGITALEALLALIATDDTAPTAIRDPARAVDAHVADALSGLSVPELAEATDVADVGAGAGIPGLVLAAARPRMRLTAIDSVRHKCAFMERAIAAMGLANAAVVCERVEAWAIGRERCDAVTVRAVAPLSVLVEYAAPLLRAGGALVAWKGPAAETEVADAGAAASALGLALTRVQEVSPFEHADQRRLYVYLKVGSLPNGYPRRPGMARKRPIRASG